MEKPSLRLFIAAAFMAALTGCPAPVNPMSDTGVIPTPDSGMPDEDGGSDPVDAYVPPGEDAGTDAGVIPSVCEDPEFIGLECNLPSTMAYDMSAFTCAVAINSDFWWADGASEAISVTTTLFEGVLYGSLVAIVGYNSGILMPDGVGMTFTCGNENRCWFNWYNEGSNYSKCRISFSGDCSHATVECWMPESATPIVSGADYAGPT